MNIFSNMYKNDSINTNHANQKYCVVKNGVDQDKIEEFYHHKVRIITKDREYNTYIYHKNNLEIITYQNEKIPIKEIISIEKIS